MRIFKQLNRLTTSALAVSLVLGSFVPLNVVFDIEAKAQNNNSGFLLNRNNRRFNNANVTIKRRGVIDQLTRDVNNPLFVRREIFNTIKGQRSGVRLGNIGLSSRNNAIRLIERDIKIRRRNDDLLRRNELRKLQSSLRRTRSNGRLLTRQEQADILNSEVFLEEASSASQGSGVVLGASTCPSKHNCGYRIYSNGTGPRIITPGVNGGNGLPDFDGINGPSIITLD